MERSKGNLQVPRDGIPVTSLGDECFYPTGSFNKPLCFFFNVNSSFPF